MRRPPTFLVGALAVLVASSCTPPEPESLVNTEAELTIQLLANAIALADTAVVLDLFWPEATYDDFANQHTYQGIQEIVGYVMGAHEWGDDVYMNFGRIHTNPFGAVGEWTFSAVHARPLGERIPEATGNEVVLNGVTIIEMEGGRIMRAADYTDTAPLTLQLGGQIVMPGGQVITLEDLGN